LVVVEVVVGLHLLESHAGVCKLIADHIHNLDKDNSAITAVFGKIISFFELKGYEKVVQTRV
jgi:hypothetical protein